MHVELDITGSKLRYTSGDHVAIFPVNNPLLVDRIGELLQADLDAVVTLSNMDGKTILMNVNHTGHALRRCTAPTRG